MAEFKHTETGEVLGAEDGSMLERRLLRSPVWEAQEAGDQALSSLSREELEAKATDLGLDLEAITGSGKDGAVVKADVLKAVQDATAS